MQSLVTEKRTAKIESIELIRAISCLLVVFSHTAFGAGIGAVAVNFFFIISGYVIMLSTEKENRPFWKKRLLKILPLYYVMTLFTSVLVLVLPSLFNSYEVTPVYLIKTLLFIPYEHSGIEQPILGLGWTLNFEMLFYLIFWISKKLSHKNRGYITLAVCVVLSTLGVCLKGIKLLPFTYWCNSYLLEFGFGIIAFEIMKKTHKPTAKKSYVSTMLFYLAVAVSLVLMTYIREYLTSKGFGVLEGAVCGLICLFVLLIAISLDTQIYKLKLLIFIARVSYPLYLIHIYPVRAVDVLANKLGFNNIAVAIFGVVIATICAFVYDKIIKTMKKTIKRNKETI